MALMLSKGRQANTCFRGVKSTSGKVNTGVPQGSNLSPPLFSLYIVDMRRPTYPIKWVYYADDITVWASGVNIPDLEVRGNNCVPEGHSLLIYTPVFSHVALSRPLLIIQREYQARTPSLRPWQAHPWDNRRKHY